jgi:hypothetical protein
MYSLIITVQSISLVGSLVCLNRMKQYRDEVVSTFGHGEGYIILSLIWPPPIIERFCITMLSAQLMDLSLQSGGINNV